MSNADGFARELQAFLDDDVIGRATLALREAAETAAEAIVIGNEYGPGVGVDSAFGRSSFRASVGEPEIGPTEPPVLPGRKPGTVVFETPLDLSAFAGYELGDGDLHLTSGVEYLEHQELGSNQYGVMARRFGVNAGAPTPFIAPVEARWEPIVNDSAARVGYGAP